MLLSAQRLPRVHPPSGHFPVTDSISLCVCQPGSEPSTCHTETALEINACRVSRMWCTVRYRELGGHARDPAMAVRVRMCAGPEEAIERLNALSEPEM